MQLFELKADIAKKKLNNIYYFTGEEVGIMNIYINKLVDAGKLEAKRVDTLSGIYSRLTNATFATKPACFIIRDDKEFLKAENLWDSLEGAFADNMVIMLFTSLDKRGKFYKQFKDKLVAFEKLSPEVLSKYVLKEIDLPQQQAVNLANMCQCDYTRVLLECDKVKHLASANQSTHAAAFKELVDSNLIYYDAGDVTFPLIDAVCGRRPKAAYELLGDFKRFSDSPLGVITLLYNNFKSILIVQGYHGHSITESTGLTGWQVSMAKKHVGVYSMPELVKAMKLLKSVERGIKTGWIDAGYALDYVLALTL